MTKIIYNKLVRDHIPEIIAASGKQAQIFPLENTASFQEALLTKLDEETQEVKEAVGEGDLANIRKELADVYEVIDALLTLTGITHQQLLAEQAHRRQTRGGFERRLWLRSVGPPEEHPSLFSPRPIKTDEEED